MKSSWLSRALTPRHEFRISRAQRREVRNVFVRVERDGMAGYGEASPNAFYNETPETVEHHLAAARPWLESLRISTVADIEAAWEEGWRWLSPSRAAQCAVDLALWDWLARSKRVSVCELLWGRAPHDIPTFCTIGLSTPDELTGKLAELGNFPRIKLKSDKHADIGIVRRVREKSAAMLAVDANCAWGALDLETIAGELESLRVEFIEQPLPPGEEAAIPARRRMPVLADESCVVESDIDRAAPFFDGFNIKLVKCGGLTPARRMTLRGRQLDRSVMIGCMLESSLLIAAGAALAQHTHYADLDGAWLLADDPFTGWNFRGGILHPPADYGLGAAPAALTFF
ncbi:MAG: dipeptide epimerase [Chthoniobacterales bacterium]